MSTRVIAAPWLKRLWSFYCAQLAERPILSRALTSTVGFATGDAIAQSLTSENFDWNRNLKFAVFGLCVHGPLGHTFYKSIDKFVYPAQRLHKKTVILKTLIDQSMWSPSLLFMFFSFQHTWDRKLNQLETVLKKDFLSTWRKNVTLWIPAHLVNYSFVPPSQRLLYVNLVAIVWVVILSSIAEKKLP